MNKSQFKPAWWLPNSHLQTMWPVFCRREVDLPLERERITLPDGDFIDLDWLKNPVQPKKVVIILHGLEGSIDSHYAKGILKSIANCGWNGVFMHFRGCSGEPNRLARDYHSGETEDLSHVIQLIINRFSGGDFAAVGYSLGGNVLLKWLGETAQSNPLQAAIAISVPFELKKASLRIQKGFSRFYQWYFLKCLRDRLANKLKVVSYPIESDRISKLNTMFEFDNLVTAPVHGFTSADEYYSIASSRQYLGNIHVPTLIVHAKDDPFMSADVIPNNNEISPAVMLEITETGGHVGFVGGKLPWRPEYWLEQRIPEFLASYLK